MIRQAIIPLAGLGTRLLPLTSVYAKELLPINGKVGLEYIIDECVDAGIKEIIFIISKKKEIIKKYFYNDKFYKKIIKKKKDERIIREYKKIKRFKKMIRIKFISSKIMNQLSYHVDKTKLSKEGIILNNKIENDIKDTINLLKNIQ